MIDVFNKEFISKNFKKGDNTYGLTLRGKKEKIEKFITNKEFEDYNMSVKEITENILEVKFLDRYGKSAYVPTTTANKILINFPSFKYTTFWEKRTFDGAELYIVYSESGTSDITNSAYVSLLSEEDDYNPLLETDITDSVVKKYKYCIFDSTYEDDEVEVEYGYPFSEIFNNSDYKEISDNENIFIEESKDEIYQKLKELDYKFINSDEFKKINNDPKYMLIFLEYNPNHGYLISDKLKDDENFIYKCIENDNDNELDFMSDRLKNDIEFVLKLLKINKKVYYSLPSTVRENPKIKEATMISIKDLLDKNKM